MLKTAAAILQVLLCAGLARAAEIQTTGDRIEDGVVSISTQGGRLALATSGGRTFALADVKEIRFAERAPRASDVLVYLLSGEELRGTVGDEVKQGDTFELAT